jgi:hypothetical protein
MKAETFDIPWLAMDLPFPCEIHLCEIKTPVTPGNKKVLALFSEPKKGMISNDWVEKNYRYFDLIVTYDHALAHLPNVRLLYFGSSSGELAEQKHFGVSYLLSTGGNDPHYNGYAVRRDVAMHFGWSHIPGRMFFSSRHLAMTKEQLEVIVNRSENNNYSVAMADARMKTELMTSMFHIAIENNNDDYYFTEKIGDCFRTYTVPIYWGTDKVLELFDKDGIIFARDARDIYRLIDELTVEDYWKRLPALVHNFEISKQYMDVAGRLRKLIIETLS